MKKLIIVTVFTLPAALFLSGCVAALGNGPVTNKPTVGQELIDLQKARDSGVVSDAEYHRQREQILNRK